MNRFLISLLFGLIYSSGFAANATTTQSLVLLATSSWNINFRDNAFVDLDVDLDIGSQVWDLLQKHLDSGNENQLIKAITSTPPSRTLILADNFYCEQMGTRPDSSKTFKTRVTSEGVFTANRSMVTAGLGAQGKATAYRLANDEILINLENDSWDPGSITKLRHFLSHYNSGSASIECATDSCSFVVTPYGAFIPRSK
jgi:hypothetical protein